MAKYSGNVGYVTETVVDGVVIPQVMDRFMTGDILSIRKAREPYATGGKVNDDISLSNRVSLIGDPYAYENFMWIKYVTWMGTKWKVASIEINSPRIICTLGGIYVG